jgi:uncharacterized protein YwqG
MGASVTIQTLDQLREQVRLHHLERLENEILQVAKPCARIVPTRVGSMDEIPLGASRLGGLPDLPADYQWKTYQGKPLTFIGQFRLSEIAPMDTEGILPHKGLLYFFFESIEQASGSDQTERPAWDVLYVPDESVPLIRTPHPVMETKHVRLEALPANRVDVIAGISLPHHYSSHIPFSFQNESEHHSYWNLVGAISENGTSSIHQFLGYPNLIQSDVEEYADIGSQSVSIEQRFPYRNANGTRWQFLLQIDSDTTYPPQHLGTIWASGGMLYICIPKASLAQHRFEDCWTILQWS